MSAVLKSERSHASYFLKEAKAFRDSIKVDIERQQRNLAGAQHGLQEARQWRQKHQDAVEAARAAHVGQRDEWLGSGRVGPEPVLTVAAIEGDPFGCLVFAADAVATAESDVQRLAERLADLRSRLSSAADKVTEHATAIAWAEVEVEAVAISYMHQELVQRAQRCNASEFHLRGDAPPGVRAAYAVVARIQHFNAGIHRGNAEPDPEIIADQAFRARIAQLSFD